MTPQETRRAEYRIGLFKRRGWTGDRAQAFVERLRERDAERDDRRACIECAHAQRDGGCFAAKRGLLKWASKHMSPVMDVLQRCEGFKWQKP